MTLEAHLDCRSTQVRTWRKANPSLNYMPHLLERIRLEAADCKRDSALLPQFRALRLNQGTSDIEIQLLVSMLKPGYKPRDEAQHTGPYCLGLGLGHERGDELRRPGTGMKPGLSGSGCLFRRYPWAG